MPQLSTDSATATSLPVMEDDLLRVQDDLDEARQLITAAYMASADLQKEEGAPLRTLLSVIKNKLEDLSDRLTDIRRNDHEETGDDRS